MKRKHFIALTGAVLTALGVCITAASVSASSDTDPLITLSYLENIAFPKFKDEIKDEVSGDFGGSEGFSDADKSYTLVELDKGDTIMAKSVCEIIVRPGSEVVCVSPFPSQGIADITIGNEVLSGEEIAINSYCLIPRGNDGRGIEVVSKKAYIMIRGDYEIV